MAKRRIFFRYRDYQRFMSKVAEYILASSLELVAYCLMPNHYHFVLGNVQDMQALSKFMQRLCTSHVMYMNKRYNRVGHLFQNRYKARRITDEKDLLETTKYIHRNPIKLNLSKNWGYAMEVYPWSSYHRHLKTYSPEWLNTERIREEFPRDNFFERLRVFTESGEVLPSLEAEYGL